MSLIEHTRLSREGLFEIPDTKTKNVHNAYFIGLGCNVLSKPNQITDHTIPGPITVKEFILLLNIFFCLNNLRSANVFVSDAEPELETE